MSSTAPRTSSAVTLRLAAAVVLVAAITLAILVAIGALGAPEAHACVPGGAPSQARCFWSRPSLARASRHRAVWAQHRDACWLAAGVQAGPELSTSDVIEGWRASRCALVG
jgi:hypothetical protein